MRKVIAALDTEQRTALLHLTDFGIAICASGLIVSLLKVAADLL
jgi:hypothetical protein